jgi:hypothetical protein
MNRNVLDRLSDAAIVALCVDGEAWPRSLLATTLIPDKWIGLIERRDGRRWLVPAGEEPKCERGDRLLLVRNRPITVPLCVEDVRAASGHSVCASCELLIRWEARDADLAALGATLLDRGDLSLDGLARAVADGGARAALQNFIRQQPAAKLVHEDVADELFEALRAELKRFLFSAGLTLERLATLKLSSDSLAHEERLQRETAARVERIKSHELVQQAALAATQRRLEGLSGVFEKLKTVASGGEQMQWHDLLPALSPAERGQLLENLWRLTPDRKIAQAVVVVAGGQCLWLDPAAPETVTRRVTLGADLGGLRSVSFNAEKDWLLVGAARGVWALHAQDGTVAGRFEVQGSGSVRTGFNAAAVVGGRLYATHSQSGAWSWSLESPQECRSLLEPRGGVPKTIRALTPLSDGHLALGADNHVRLFDVAGNPLDFPGELTSTVHCLTALDRGIYAGVEDGSLFAFHLDGPDVWVRLHRAGGPFESIQARRWNDLVELVIPAGAQGILGVFSQEGIVAQLVAAPTPIRRAWACDDLVMGLSDYRDRLILLNAHAAERGPRQVPLGRTLGCLVEDACIVTGNPGPDGKDGGAGHVG